MNKLILNLTLIVLLAFSSNAQETIIKKGLLFDNNFIDAYPLPVSIDKVNYDFKGYLCIKINSTNDKENTSYYYSNIFWIKSLQDIENTDTYFWYICTLKFWLGYYNIKDNIIPICIRDYLYLFQSINEESKKVYNTYLYDYKDWITTDVLDSVKLWNINEENYLLFETSFSASIIKAENSKNINLEKEKIIFNTLIPISPLYYINQISSVNAKGSGFKESNLRVRLE
ncbi:MAG: hypothetical protein IT280_04035 [Ignavibacteria bacterium]|nr:hypothetical protein [Ignavibacteria bacterium]